MYEEVNTRDATCTAAFEPTEAWQIALAQGATVDVLDVAKDGWAEVRDAQGNTGKAPASYLQMHTSHWAARAAAVALSNAYDWINRISKSCEKERDCKYHLDSLIRMGTSRHDVVIKALDGLTLETASTDYGRQLVDYDEKYRAWLGRWRTAVAEAATVGLHSTISYAYWQEHVRLPKVVTGAYKWFATVERMIKTTDLDAWRLAGFTRGAGERILAIRACEDSWPPARRYSIQRRVLKFYALTAQWHEAAAESTLDAAGTGEAFQIWADAHEAAVDASQVVARHAAAMRRRRAILLKKRTCSMCGKTAPNSKPAFEYCGGCRHASIPRVDRPRYCSEACQRAHWLAGHAHKCRCVHERVTDF